MSLKSWYSNLRKWGKSPAQTAMEQRQLDSLEGRESHSVSMALGSKSGRIKTLETLADKLGITVVKDLSTETANFADAFSMHKVSFSGDDWALIVHNSFGKWEVKTSKGSHLFDNYFDAMLEVAAFYGVNVDESSDCKEQD